MNVLRPLACLLPNGAKNTALIVLNQPLEKTLLKRVWKCSLYKAVTDGGANQLFSCLGALRDDYIPDIITGDFDSAKHNVLDYYKQKLVSVISTPDQDETDFTKCLRLVVDDTEQTGVEQYLAVGSVGGRMDHHYGNIQTLFTAAALTPKPLYLVSKGNLACLLPKGKTTIHLDTGLEDEYCGLIPIGCPCDHVTTTGLKWNLNDQVLAFGQLISTSNGYSQKVVTVETDQPLLWTMTYNLPEENG